MPSSNALKTPLVLLCMMLFAGTIAAAEPEQNTDSVPGIRLHRNVVVVPDAQNSKSHSHLNNNKKSLEEFLSKLWEEDRPATKIELTKELLTGENEEETYHSKSSDGESAVLELTERMMMSISMSMRVL
jgi:hypothetical protein